MRRCKSGDGKCKKAMDVSLALEEMRRRAVEKAVEENRIFILLKSIRNLMEKARQRVQFRWYAGHSMDVLDASEGGQEKASAAYQIRVHFGCSYL